MKKLTILLVDDSAEDRELATRTLNKYTFIDKVYPFREAQAALDFLSDEGANTEDYFILLDLNMPKISGLEFIRLIKSNERLKSIPVAVLTGTTELPDIKESMRLGVKYYIAKPVESEDIERIAGELGYLEQGGTRSEVLQ